MTVCACIYIYVYRSHFTYKCIYLNLWISLYTAIKKWKICIVLSIDYLQDKNLVLIFHEQVPQLPVTSVQKW